MVIINKLIFSNEIEQEIEDTIEQYYNLNEEQLNFIYSLLKHKEFNWTKFDLIKSLLIFNKCKEFNIDISQASSEILVDYIDEKNQSIINNLIVKYDKFFLIKNLK